MDKDRILVVDDEDVVRRVVVALLEHAGFEAVEAAGADEALKLLRNGQQFTMAMSDVMMPETDGLTLLDTNGPAQIREFQVYNGGVPY